MDELVETRRALRSQVCMECHRRPPGSDMLGPKAARSCEGACEVFNCLPRLVAMVHRFGGEPPCGYRAAIQSLICTDCSGNSRLMFLRPVAAGPICRSGSHDAGDPGGRTSVIWAESFGLPL